MGRRAAWTVLAGVAAALGAGSPALGAPDGAVLIVDFGFSPHTLLLTLDALGGNHVTFHNGGASTHEPRADPHGAPGEGVCFQGPAIPVDASATVAVHAACAALLGPAKIPYHCHIHPFMLGEVVILPT